MKTNLKGQTSVFFLTCYMYMTGQWNKILFSLQELFLSKNHPISKLMTFCDNKGFSNDLPSESAVISSTNYVYYCILHYTFQSHTEFYLFFFSILPKLCTSTLTLLYFDPEL